MKRYFCSLIFNFLAFTILIFSYISFANFTVMPTKLEINKNNKVATMTLQNNDLTEKRFQVTVLKRENKNGKEEYKETKDLIATPGMYVIQGGKMQLIRIAVKNKENISTAENAYRISVRELPHTIKVDNLINSKVDLVVEFNVPITVSG